ncbi:MAG: pyruvate kinase [Gammaproteobacteria bacterium]|nr:pyruvate kinase [Gammaproteobacteria bacterium]
MRRTKIIATLGPATNNPDTVTQLCEAGVDVVRINFSHGDWTEHKAQISMVRDISRKLGREIGVLGDLQGPKIRIDRFRDGAVTLVDGQTFVLDAAMDADGGTDKAVGVAYEGLAGDVDGGDVLLLDDGQIVLQVDAVDGPQIRCTVTSGGVLADKKGINRKGGGLSATALTEKDLRDLKMAVEAGVDWLAVSFVREADDMHRARKQLREAGGHAHLIAKIERTEAMDNLEAIVDASDAVMVARGDLGVEMGYAALAGLQKRIIGLTRERHKVSITATQMMESMIQNQIPTRAEVSDVANAVMDGTDAVMLSAETATGAYPVKAVAAMAEICTGAEIYHQSASRMSRHRLDDRFNNVDEAIAMAVMYTANHLDVQAIIALTESGSTAQWMSRIRSDIPIFAFTRHESTQRRAALYRGVYPLAFDVTHDSTGPVIREVCQILVDMGHVRPGQLVIFTKGALAGITGGTNQMRILPVTGQ